MKCEALRRFQPSEPDQARNALGAFADHYNNVRLHSAIGYITPADMLAGRRDERWRERDRKLEEAREKRRRRRRLQQRREAENLECVA